MRRADRIAGVLLLAFAAWFAGVALRWYPYWGDTGPGPGFLPVWLGAAMAVLAALLLVGARRGEGPEAPWLPRGRGRVRLVAVVGATAGFVALLRPLGMTLGAGLFLVAILRFVEGYRWRTTLAIAAGVAGLNYLVFTRWLGVPFPVGLLGF